jgi:hypothetical protein
MSIDDYRWLVGADAQPWLEEASASRGNVLALTSRLRKSLSAGQAHLVLQQVELRCKAREKFSAAERMFFTPRGLEQATDESVARYKASRMPEGRLADLCCGIGGDLLGLARRGPVLAVDRDPVAALLAEANCRACGLAIDRSIGVRPLATDVLQVSLEDCAAAHLDPDRRPAGRRTTRIEAHEPNLEEIEPLLARTPGMAIKLAPATEPPDAWHKRAEWEWISRGGQCRQLVAWFGTLAEAVGARRATLLGAEGSVLRTLVGEPGVEASQCRQIGRYVYEPDAAVLAAGLDAALAAEHSLQALCAGIGYFTGDLRIENPALAAFEVEASLPFDFKRLRNLLHQRGIGRLEIKKRGVDLDPAQLRRQLSLRGSNEATLIITRHNATTLALLCRRTA